MTGIRAILSYLLFWILSPFLLLSPRIRQGVRARLGFYPQGWIQAPRGPRVWLHGASAGDVLALRPTAIALRRLRPEVEIVVSTITDSGMNIAKDSLGLFHAVTYAPYDIPGAVNRAFRAIQPNMLILEYTELWPQMIGGAKRMGVPVVWHNGRISEGLLGRYRLLFALTGNLLSGFTALLMRGPDEAERAATLGAVPERIRTTGNTKFDNLKFEMSTDEVTRLKQQVHVEDGDLVWVAGSTHEGEEAILLNIYQCLLRTYPGLKLLIAPRYVERASRIVALAQRRGMDVCLRSSARPAATIIVVDTVGELRHFYAMATLVFVGGSFTSRGGQNILEPASCGKPVLFGPHMENFADAVRVLLGRGALQASTEEQLLRILDDLLARPDYREELGRMARANLRAMCGAAPRNAEIIDRLLNGEADNSSSAAVGAMLG